MREKGFLPQSKQMPVSLQIFKMGFKFAQSEHLCVKKLHSGSTLPCPRPIEKLVTFHQEQTLIWFPPENQSGNTYENMNVIKDLMSKETTVNSTD